MQFTPRRKLRALIAFAIYTTYEQRAKRCLNLKDHFQCQELQCTRAWSPKEYPEWLLFEVEQNKMIRQKQFEVAKAKLDLSTNAGSVLQLNMGEGKTSVILPILCAGSWLAPPSSSVIT